MQTNYCSLLVIGLSGNYSSSWVVAITSRCLGIFEQNANYAPYTSDGSAMSYGFVA